MCLQSAEAQLYPGASDRAGVSRAPATPPPCAHSAIPPSPRPSMASPVRQRSRRAAQGAAAPRPSPHSRPQNSAKARSVWEQRAGQLQLQNLRATCEALYSEMDREERLRYTTTRHLRPDMKMHLDRPLMVELGREGPRVPMGGKAQPEGPEAAEGTDPPRRHHRH
ncbi:PREDICTED: voltage-dependent N-type calcium channel subunit alpha-1B-like, partial [Odobenus rosmarus divergens]|uniref:Voltage-dependent N-type calcium channel subunit alpha-1B-like n=1 Tax=Odobenus rosmarus divergens TaxID=9708 RepID=A0A9B0HHH5_ODORO